MADLHAFLDFDKGPDLHVIAQLAPVKICKRENPDPLAKFYVRSNLLEKLIALVHAGTIVRLGSGAPPLPLTPP